MCFCDKKFVKEVWRLTKGDFERMAYFERMLFKSKTRGISRFILVRIVSKHWILELWNLFKPGQFSHSNQNFNRIKTVKLVPMDLHCRAQKWHIFEIFLKFYIYMNIYRSCRKVTHFWEFRWNQNVTLLSTTVYVS